MRCIPQSNPVLHSPTTPCQFNMWKHADIPKWDVSPQIDPSASEPYYTMSAWHVEACRHTQMRCISPNQTQCFIALLHHVCLTCGSMQTYPNEMYSPIKPSASEPYYTMSVWHVEACRHTQMRCISPNQTQCFRALLHNICLTCGSMQTYPNEMYPPNQTQCFRALLHHVCLTFGSMQTYPNENVLPQLKPSDSEPYYTMSVWHVEACRHTQMRCILPN